MTNQESTNNDLETRQELEDLTARIDRLTEKVNFLSERVDNLCFGLIAVEHAIGIADDQIVTNDDPTTKA